MKVSVWMTAYNHEKYLAQCLNSVLMQKTDFDFEIILGEDCSKDRTREIAIDFQKKYPDKIKLFLPEKNIGMMQMDVATHGLCKGEYIALLNGDDYWTDENKLQIQADFLDANPDSVMCYHKALVENEDTGYTFETVYLENSDTLPVKSLFLGYNPVMTPTVMVRNIIELPQWYAEMPYGDMLLYLLLSQKGKIKYIDKLMSIYRIHPGGQWQGETVYNNLLKDLKFYRVMNEKLGYKYDELIRHIFAQRYFDMIIIDIKGYRYFQAKRYFKKLILTDRQFLKNNRRDIINLYRILHESADENLFGELLNRQVKWKIK
ncbi:MAG TPA: glycosyltransferase [Ignavibacteria bacterium]|nr:glycosyltransferase [Ignavibacteria bacterium]